MSADIDASRLRILIAGDNHLTATEMDECIKGSGYAVAGVAPSAEQGLAPIATDAVDGALVGWSPDASPSSSEPTFANALLDSLPPAAKTALAAFVERAPLRHGEVLDRPGQPIGHVYFPTEGLISMFAGMTAASRIEVACIGRDGMTAPGVLLGDLISPGRTTVQANGSAWRVPASILQRLGDGDASLHCHLLNQVGVMLRQLADAASYSGRATIVERLARWLAQATYHLGSRRLDITHDALAEILGVRRPSVTTSLQLLEGKRLIRSTRRIIVVLNPEGLAELAMR